MVIHAPYSPPLLMSLTFVAMQKEQKEQNHLFMYLQIYKPLHGPNLLKWCTIKCNKTKNVQGHNIISTNIMGLHKGLLEEP